VLRGPGASAVLACHAQWNHCRALPSGFDRYSHFVNAEEAVDLLRRFDRELQEMAGATYEDTAFQSC
jgi:hypothetical protein